MTIDEIRELISVVNQSGIAELEVTRGENRVRIRRSNVAAPQEFVLPAQPAVIAAPMPTAITAAATPSPAPPPAVSSAPQPAGTAAVTSPAPDERTLYVKSPIVGTYYESASPGSPPFVKIGDRVSQGQVLCIIESMKLMNEIECEVSGTLISKLVENGRPVEYGETLFAIQP